MLQYCFLSIQTNIMIENAFKSTYERAFSDAFNKEQFGQKQLCEVGYETPGFRSFGTKSSGIKT